MQKKILIITYYWPPCGGAGVQRWLKFVKYLPGLGFDPVVLTIDSRYASYPATDETLMGEVPPEVEVIRTKALNWFSMGRSNGKSGKGASAGFANGKTGTPASILMRFIRGNFFIPDPRRGWNRHAIRKAAGLIRSEGITSFVTTSPPHSTQLIGLKLKKKFPHLNWIADLRDPWTDIYYYRMFLHTPLAGYIDSRYEKRVLTECDLITTVGDSLAKLFISKVPAVKGKVEVLTNGYDEDDFRGLVATERQGKFTITYVGTISDQYPVDGLLEALRQINDEGEMDILLKFVGFAGIKTMKKVREVLGEDRVQLEAYKSHRESIQEMLNTDMLLLAIPDHPMNRLIITGKIFEYIRAGKPILCLGPEDGDAAGIIREAGAGITVQYNDSQKIVRFIKNPTHKVRDSIETTQWDRASVIKHLLPKLR